MSAAVETTINSRELPPVLEKAEGTGSRDKNLEVTFTGNTGHDVGISTAGLRANKYNHKEWLENNYAKYLQSYRDREASKDIRNDSTNVINATEATIARMQDDVTKKLGERVQDVSFWKFELERVINDLMAETNLLFGLQNQLENAYRSTELPLHIATDNLNCRLGRIGIDFVEDPVELCILKEVKTINDVRDLLKKTIARVQQQIATNREAKHRLEMDWSDKKETIEIDNRCGMLRDHHTNKQFYPGSARFQEIQSSPETWAQFSHDTIVMAENERMASVQLRGLVENILEDTSKDIVEQHYAVLKEFQKHLQQLDDAKFKIQTHLKKICQEINDAEKNIENLLKAIRDKEDAMKKTQTRLEARSHRPGVELCRDIPQYKMIAEVDEINNSITALNERLNAARNQLKNLQDTRMGMEKEITNKINSIFIDRQKCLSVRERYPTSLKLKGIQ